jgi:beta-barrel assembly-enhancing protease
MRRLIAGGIAALCLPATAHAQRTVEALPTYTAAYTPTTVDERGLWGEADEAERALRDSRTVIRDDDLNAYVRRVLCQTVGEDRCGSVRLYIMRVPAFNATMYPNGLMTVWSGLLLRVRSEAELGAILGHEFGHFELRHSVSGFKNRRANSDVMAWASVLAASNTGIQIDALGHVYSFNRKQERDADLLGHRYLVQSRYPSIAAADVWHRLMGEADATAFGRKGKANHRYVAGFFDTHPTDLARATYLKAATAEAAEEKVAAVDGHTTAMEKWLPLFLADQIKLNDFGGSEYILNGLAERSGWTGALLFARGELYRERGNPRDLVTAAQFYRQAIAAGSVAPEAHRGLGYTLMRTQQPAEGRAALAEYLRLKPDAADAALIQTMIAE